jgi:hypothetical protein
MPHPTDKNIIGTRLGPLPSDFRASASSDKGITNSAANKAKLREQLKHAYDVSHSTTKDEGEGGTTDQDGLKRRRDAAQLAIRAFVEWAQTEGGFPAEHLYLLVKLSADLGDLNSGKHPDLLRPDSRPGRGGSYRQTDQTMRQVAACVAIDAFSEKMPVSQAERQVARLTGLPEGELRSWRKALKSRRKGSQISSAFDEMRKIVFNKPNPMEAAREALLKIGW